MNSGLGKNHCRVICRQSRQAIIPAKTVRRRRTTTSRSIQTRSCATAEGPRDALCQSKSFQQLHDCKNKLYNISTANRSDGVRGLQSTDAQWINYVRLCNHPRRVDHRRCDPQARPSTSFVNRLPWRNFLRSRVWRKVPVGSTVSLFRMYLNFINTQCRIGQRKLLSQCQINSSSWAEQFLVGWVGLGPLQQKVLKIWKDYFNAF